MKTKGTPHPSTIKTITIITGEGAGVGDTIEAMVGAEEMATTIMPIITKIQTLEVNQILQTIQIKMRIRMPIKENKMLISL